MRLINKYFALKIMRNIVCMYILLLMFIADSMINIQSGIKFSYYDLVDAIDKFFRECP